MSIFSDGWLNRESVRAGLAFALTKDGRLRSKPSLLAQNILAHVITFGRAVSDGTSTLEGSN
jgi:hypothetical protein